jgi:predicted GNAT superfamily acetyltransferase
MNVRALAGHEEFTEAVRLQRLIWGFEDLELLPVRLFVVASKIGGQVLGAFDEHRMAGFCLAIPGLKPGGEIYLHSHMLGVLPEWRNAGVGKLLKLDQRRDALARGIQVIEWTFDPFEVKNAYFNIHSLGAIVPRYVRNMYGVSTSPLHGGLPTDRCVAQWWIARPPVEAAAVARVALPAEKTRESQAWLATELEQHFARGLVITGFERSGGTGSYLLSAWDSR